MLSQHLPRAEMDAAERSGSGSAACRLQLHHRPESASVLRAQPGTKSSAARSLSVGIPLEI